MDPIAAPPCQPLGAAGPPAHGCSCSLALAGGFLIPLLRRCGGPNFCSLVLAGVFSNVPNHLVGASVLLRRGHIVLCATVSACPLPVGRAHWVRRPCPRPTSGRSSDLSAGWPCQAAAPTFGPPSSEKGHRCPPFPALQPPLPTCPPAHTPAQSWLYFQVIQVAVIVCWHQVQRLKPPGAGHIYNTSAPPSPAPSPTHSPKKTRRAAGGSE